MRFAFLSMLVAAVSTPAAAQVAGDAPAPPVGAAPNQTVPPHDASGAYATPNRGLNADEMSWHVRAALNVAALGCRDAAEAETVARYNRMIARYQKPLAAADAGVKATYRARFGGDWKAEHDTRMTRLYNFFAQPPAQSGFCAIAREILGEIDHVAPAQFALYAAEALPRLEAPFTDFYRAYDSYRVAYAAWQDTRRAPATMVASVSPAPSAARRTVFP